MKKAKVFTKEELETYHGFANTPETIFRKCYSSIATAFGARGVEVFAIKWNQIVELSLPGGRINYRIQYQRAKQTEPDDGEDFQLCTGALEVTAIRNYIQCFQLEDQSDRFFRKLKYNSFQQVVGTKQVVGRHTAANVGKEIANALGLPMYESYTGHCWRRVTGTWAADAGLSLPEIKQLTGHKSDRVVQGYIDKSILQKRKGAAAMAIGKRPTLENVGNTHGIHVTVNVTARE